MRITVLEQGRSPIRLRLFSGTAFNRLAALLLRRLAKKYGFRLTLAQSGALVRALNDYRRVNPDWKLVEVQTADGKQVIITV